MDPPQLERRMRLALGADVDGIAGALVTAERKHGAHGSVYTRVRLELRPSPGAPVVVTELQADADAALSRAIDRAIRTLRRRQIGLARNGISAPASQS